MNQTSGRVALLRFIIGPGGWLLLSCAGTDDATSDEQTGVGMGVERPSATEQKPEGAPPAEGGGDADDDPLVPNDSASGPVVQQPGSRPGADDSTLVPTTPMATAAQGGSGPDGAERPTAGGAGEGPLAGGSGGESPAPNATATAAAGAGTMGGTGGAEMGGAGGAGNAGSGASGAPARVEAVSFTQVEQDVFEPTGCTAGYCHGGGAGDMVWSYQALVGEAAAEPVCGLTQRVVPGDPESSILWQRVRPDEPDGEESCAGEKMPKDRPLLTEAQAQLIYDWIATGAAP